MSDHVLSIVVSGPGTDANHRSHWAFAIHKRNVDIGNLLQVQVIEPKKLVYQFEESKSALVRGRGSEGSFPVASVSREQVGEVSKITREEQAPNDGVERCQDWVLKVIISLEAEELVAPGTSSWIDGLVGKSAEVVARTVAQRWIETTTPQE